MSNSGPRGTARRLFAALGFVVSTLFGAAAHSQETAVETTSQLVVMVSGDLDGAPTIGAGIVFGRDPDGFHVVTANHVVRRATREATQLRVLLKGLPNRWLEARLLPQADPSPPGLNVAVLYVPGLVHGAWTACALAVDRLAPSGALERGVPVFPVGYPGGAPWGMPVAPDLVAQVVGNEITFQSAVIANGHSGGALIADGGALAGMVRLDNPPFGVAVSIAAVLDRLRQWGYPVELRAGGSAPPLFAAVEKRDGAAVERALRDRCVAVDGLYQGRTALHEAAAQGDAAIVRALLNAGASKELRVALVDDNWDDKHLMMTPMALAASEGHVEVIRALLRAGAGFEDHGDLPDSMTRLQSMMAKTALERAVKAGHREAARLLVDTGASTAFLRQLEGGSKRLTPLHEAAHSGNVGAARLMIELGADVDAADGEGVTPLYRAVEGGRREMVETLLAAGARPNLGMRHGCGRSPLGEAVMYGGPGEVSVYKADDDVQKRETGLAIVELLVKGGADVKQAEGHGEDRQTALYLAASYGKLSVVKRLLALGVDVNLRNGGGRAALHAAAEMGGHESAGPIQRVLLETLRAAGADVNAEDDRGDPPLCRALWDSPVLGRVVVIEMLLEWGARSRLMEQCRGQSCRAWAPDEAIDRLLRSHGATDTPAR